MIWFGFDRSGSCKIIRIQFRIWNTDIRSATHEEDTFVNCFLTCSLKIIQIQVIMTKNLKFYLVVIIYVSITKGQTLKNIPWKIDWTHYGRICFKIVLMQCTWDFKEVVKIILFTQKKNYLDFASLMCNSSYFQVKSYKIQWNYHSFRVWVHNQLTM